MLDTWPDAEWERIAPEQAGWDTAALAAARDYYKTAGKASFAVVHHGRMVASQKGHLMWLIQTAARVPNPGQDPGNDLTPGRPGRRRRT